jgi:uncharacterized protein (DUF427 family)
MHTPEPTHPIAIEPAEGPVRVHFAGRIVAESERALVLREADYPPVYYVPRADADMTLFARSEHETRCPYKGEASYFSLYAGGRASVNAAWSYEKPLEGVASIAGYLAFYPERVDRIETPH